MLARTPLLTAALTLTVAVPLGLATGAAAAPPGPPVIRPLAGDR